MAMEDVLNEQFTVDGESGQVELVTDDWHPVDNGFSQLNFALQQESEDIKVGPGDYIPGPTSWVPTVIQVPMYVFGEEPGPNVRELRDGLCVPGNIGRDAVWDAPDGTTWEGTIYKVSVDGPGTRRPGGWPIMLSFTIFEPFTQTGGGS